MKCLIYGNLVILLSASNAYAYLDPGTGGFIIQMLIAFFATAFVFINNFWKKLQIFFFKFIAIFRRDKNKE